MAFGCERVFISVFYSTFIWEATNEQPELETPIAFEECSTHL